MSKPSRFPKNKPRRSFDKTSCCSGGVSRILKSPLFGLKVLNLLHDSKTAHLLHELQLTAGTNNVLVLYFYNIITIYWYIYWCFFPISKKEQGCNFQLPGNRLKVFYCEYLFHPDVRKVFEDSGNTFRAASRFIAGNYLNYLEYK